MEKIETLDATYFLGGDLTNYPLTKVEYLTV